MTRTAAVMLAAMAGASAAWGGPGRADERRFEGLRALVVEPENFWGWDAAVFGALQERGFEVAYVKPEAIDDLARLSRCDLVASTIKRRFTRVQAANLAKYVAGGGALYGSWGGPMATSGLLRDVCRVRATRSVRITGMALLDGTPLVRGVADRRITFPPVVGHVRSKAWEIVSVTPLPGGVAVAADAAGNPLGVLARHGKGRTAVLGFGPEMDKHFTRRELAPS